MDDEQGVPRLLSTGEEALESGGVLATIWQQCWQQGIDAATI
jgi:hypothetical protein